MNQLETKQKVIADVLSELSEDKFSLSEKNDSAFDIEQSDCACCCNLAVGTGGTVC